MMLGSRNSVPVIEFLSSLVLCAQASWTPWVAGTARPSEGVRYQHADASNTQSALEVDAETKLVLGVHKYCHDTGICAADKTTGKILFALSKERLTRRKHDAGNVASLVDSCLRALGLRLENIDDVIINNHHYRSLQREHSGNMEWEIGLGINGGAEPGYGAPQNLLSDAETHELSHHLAHAYTTASQAPFTSGICVVMDGMGECFRTMQKAALCGDSKYTSDLSFGLDTFQRVPDNIAELASRSEYDWREAESVYLFTKSDTHIDLRPIFKRFTQEISPPTLYDRGFENMNSLGAVYSRASTDIFGNWNACGKVMGLAPWANHTWYSHDGAQLSPKLIEQPMMTGHLYSNESPLSIDRRHMQGTPRIAKDNTDLYLPEGTERKRYDFDDSEESSKTTDALGRLPGSAALDAIALAHRVQADLETVAMDFVKHFKESTGANNLCIAGGVGLNSVLNGRLARELGFKRTYVSPYPGDEGIAIGCCAFGLFGNSYLEHTRKRLVPRRERPPVWMKPIDPYLGPEPSEDDMIAAINSASPWLEVDTIADEDVRLNLMAREIENGTVIAWYHSRSEMGPRALGHRSILADPRKKNLVRFINESVKSRESFRPFAPSVLAEEAATWYDLGSGAPANGDVSPYMSLTAYAHEAKRSLIPAVTHVDSSSRLQTVTKDGEPAYHKLISKFYGLTGVPMILNTSFNTLPSEPIVETPSDAIRSFLYSRGAIGVLVMGQYVIRRRQTDFSRRPSESAAERRHRIGALRPTRTGTATFQTTSCLDDMVGKGETATTRVQMPSRPTHGHKNEWFDLLDELERHILSTCDGTVQIKDIVAQCSDVLSDERRSREQEEANERVLQTILVRLIRLYEQTLISW